MALRGNLSTMSVGELLSFLGPGRKTGILNVESGAAGKEVVLDGGSIVFCSAGSPKELLGHHLIARARVTERDLHEAFADQDAGGGRLGEILVASGKVSPRELEAVLRRKVEDSFLEIFTWREGAFGFSDRPSAAADVPVRVEIPWRDAIARGTHRVEQLERAREVIPDGSARLRLRAWGKAPPAGRDGELVRLAERRLRVADICHRVHDSDFEVWSRLADLVRAGWLEVVPPPDDEGVRGLGDRVDRLLDAGRYSRALDTLREGVHRWPGDSAVAAHLRDVERLTRVRVEADLGDGSAVPSLSVTMDDLAAAHLSTKEAFVAARVNGRWSASSLARVCPFEHLDALAIVAELMRRGLLSLRLAPLGEAAPEVVPASAPVTPPAAVTAERAPGRAVRVGSKALLRRLRAGARAPRTKQELEPGPGSR